MFLLPPNYWEIKRTKNKGRGVFAKKEIAPGTVIGDYLGKLVKDSAVKENPLKFYAMEYSQTATIVPNGNAVGIHFINHSCSPNCVMYNFNRHMLYVAQRQIFAGEELVVNYLYRDDDGNEGTCRQHECHCGSPVCRGTLHTPAQIIKLWEHHQRENYRKKPMALSGNWLMPLKKYPTVIRDVWLDELFGCWTKRPLVCADRVLPALADIKKRIHQSGRRLEFKNFSLIVHGISDQLIVAGKL